MIVRPTPFPEELDRSYLGRVMRLNGVSSEKDIVALMAIWAGVADKSRREISCVELLSKVAGIDLAEFVRQHTTLPLRRAITSYQADLPHGSEENRSMLWTSGMRQIGSASYFCRDCMLEDLGFHGQSYWRRMYQAPGLLWCPRHSIPLSYVEGKFAYLLPPSRFVDQSIVVDEAWAAEARENIHIQRYFEICIGLMDRDAPLAVRTVSGVLRERAAAAGFQTIGGKIKKPLISDEVFRIFGRRWLATVMPSLADKATGELLHQMDGVLWLKTSASSVSPYILASALLFESADEALNALQSSTDTESRRSTSKIDTDDAISAYIQARGQYSAAARLLSTNRQDIGIRLQKIGLPNLTERQNRSTLRAALAYYIDRLPISQSASAGNLSVDEMGELIRDASPELIQVLQVMRKPAGRGTGKKRAKQLTPEEARLADGPLATKFSHDPRRDGPASQSELTAAQKVAQ
jgi:hypothetical protein